MGLGTSLISGIFGSKKKNEEVVNRVDYARMVKDAEAAGFNPLTALRNGGAAGFSVTSQPVLSSSGQAIAGVANAFGDFLQNFDPFEDKMREVQYRTMQAQLDGLQLDNSSKRKLMFDPPAVSGRRKVTAGPTVGPTVKLDGFEYRGAGKNGEIEDLWNVYRQPDGSYIRLPNPNIADSEQFATVPLAKAENVTTRPISSRIMRDGGWIRSRELTDAEKAAADEGWWPSWLPSVGFQFKEKKAK